MANTNTKNEVTEVMALEYALELAKQNGADELMLSKIEHMIDGRKGKTKKVDEEKVARDGEYKNAIVAHLLDGKKYTVTELTKAVTLINADGLSTSKVTNLLSALKSDGLVTNVKEKGKSYYSLVTDVA